MSGDKRKIRASKKPSAVKQSERDDLKALAKSLKPGPRIGATGDRFDLEDALGWIEDSTPKMPSVPLLPERINPAARADIVERGQVARGLLPFSKVANALGLVEQEHLFLRPGPLLGSLLGQRASDLDEIQDQQTFETWLDDRLRLRLSPSTLRALGVEKNGQVLIFARLLRRPWEKVPTQNIGAFLLVDPHRVEPINWIGGIEWPVTKGRRSQSKSKS